MKILIYAVLTLSLVSLTACAPPQPPGRDLWLVVPKH